LLSGYPEISGQNFFFVELRKLMGRKTLPRNISFAAYANFTHLLCLKGFTLMTGAQLTMTKAELVEEVTQLGDLTRRDGEVIVDTIFDAVIGALKSGDKIEIRGFGSFRIRQRKPRIGRNPKTGAKVEVPAKRVPYFKPSKELRDLVNPHEATDGTKPGHPPAA
jgi:integration host factor subunit beta